MIKLLLAGIVLTGLCGCTSVSEIDFGKTSYINEVTDKDHITYDEIVAGYCYAPERETKIVNIHIVLTAVMNSSVTMKTQIGISSSSTYIGSDVRHIVQATYPRIAARLVEYVQSQNAPLANLARIRSQLSQEASEVFNPVFAKWKDAEKYKVDFVVTSLYCTDGSVGRSANGRAMQWW